MDDEIVNSIKDGSYLNNCLSTIIKIRENPRNIEFLEFWGGEPTLNLNIWKEYLEDWASHFKKVRTIQFITNGTFNTEHMVDFIFEAQRVFPVLENVDLQISLDGPGEITEKYRGIKPEFLIENTKDFIKKINQRKFKVKIGVCYKPTLDIDVLNEIHRTPESATQYYAWWAKQASEIEELNFNECFKGVNIAAPIFTLLYDYTQKQGLDYANSLASFEAVDWDYINYEFKTSHDIYETANMGGILAEYYEKGYDEESQAYYCGGFSDTLMIRHDGTVVGCLAGLYNDSDLYNKELKENNNLEELEITQSIPKQLYMYPKKQTTEQLMELREHMSNVRECLPTNLAIGMAIVNELANCGQVEEIYINNYELMIKHINWLQAKTLCYFNNLRKNGIIYASVPGLYRLFFNGFLTKFENIMIHKEKMKLRSPEDAK